MKIGARLYASVGAGVLAAVMSKKRGRWWRAGLGAAIGFGAAAIIGEQRLPTLRLGA